MIVKRHVGLPENEMGIIESENMLIHNIVTSELKEKDQIITQLTNNWNELEEWLKEQLMYFNENNGQGGFSTNVEDLEMILDKMQQIKENNK